MSISFPLAIADFWNTLGLIEGDLDLVQYQKQSITGGGDILTAKFGEPKWIGNYTLKPDYHRDSIKVNALFKALLGRNGTFLAYDKRSRYPYVDQTGSVISGSTVLVRSKGADNRSIALKGLPSYYTITAGDKIGIVNSSFKRVLLEAVEDRIANVDGETVAFEVQPFLPVWIAVNDTAGLVNPLGKFKIVPGSYKPARGHGNISDGASFSMISVT